MEAKHAASVLIEMISICINSRCRGFRSTVSYHDSLQYLHQIGWAATQSLMQHGSDDAGRRRHETMIMEACKCMHANQYRGLS
jgi:hypothetical protein